MLAIPHLSQVSSMAEIVSKEAQMKLKAGICLRTPSHNKHTSRADQKLYTFKESDFPNLHLNDIKDMLLLHVQHKLFNLEGNDIIDLAVALRMFTSRIILQKRVKYVQLGVESYQKKLNITKPQRVFPNISSIESYTTYYDPKGVVYQDARERKRLMRSDELYKFYDGTL
ncbi:hypothetical protein Tco_0687046 [Tanacetum coccineum]